MNISAEKTVIGTVGGKASVDGSIAGKFKMDGKITVGRPLATIEVCDIEGGYKIIVTDPSGKQELNIMNGIGIASIEQTMASTEDDGNNVLTVTFTNGQTATFTVQNGSKGSKGDDGKTPKKGVDYFDGEPGPPGYTPQKGVDYFDGYTPVKGKDYFDGKDGYTPVKGKDYFDGKDGYTPVKGKDYFDGKNGQDGKTPVKGVDYFDGKNGEDGKTPIKGTDYFTEADKSEMVSAVKAQLITEQWTFTLTDGTTVTKDVVTE